MVVEVILPELFKVLMFKATENNYVGIRLKKIGQKWMRKTQHANHPYHNCSTFVFHTSSDN